MCQYFPADGFFGGTDLVYPDPTGIGKTQAPGIFDFPPSFARELRRDMPRRPLVVGVVRRGGRPSTNNAKNIKLARITKNELFQIYGLKTSI